MTEKESQEYETLCIGGDFAGLQTKFDNAGALIPVPEHLLPEDLVQWGQEPSSLEVIVSEVWSKQDSNSLSSSSSSILERQTITILPAIGCAIDNLETMKKEESFAKDQYYQWTQPNDSLLCFDTSITSAVEIEKRVRLETCFSLKDSHRLRISLDLTIRTNDEGSFSHAIHSPILVYFERQTNTISSRGAIADGGLDGRTVSSMLGDWLWKSHSFAKQKPQIMKGGWQSDHSLLPPNSVHLPGNITISSGIPPQETNWLIEISHYPTASSDNELEGRRTVRRSFHGFHCEYECVT